MKAGEQLGPYRIEAAIGEGGMGKVYRARDTRLDRTVALKVAKHEFSERFEREARAVAAFNHPNICTPHDVGPNYLLMAYVDGTPLKGPLPVEEAVEYAVQWKETDATLVAPLAGRAADCGHVAVCGSGELTMDGKFLNISAYRFVALDDLAVLRGRLRDACVQAGLKGTILLAPEGINLFLAGEPDKLSGWVAWLKSDARFAGVEPKESWSDHQPFNRMLVKLKKEIITMRQPQVRPIGVRAPAVRPLDLKRWLDAGHDDSGRPVVMLDTRNAFEVEIGTFEGAVNPGLRSFGQFPERVSGLREGLQDKTVVTFCTGGIRCEKAVLYMQDHGFENVFQLDGGILKYFEEVGGDHYHGECFVFDRRVALTPDLKETGTVECFNCRAVVPAEEQRAETYVFGKSCGRCLRAGSSR